jgi:hypothetical protein
MVTLDGVIPDYGGLWVRFSATLGREPEVEIALI